MSGGGVWARRGGGWVEFEFVGRGGWGGGAGRVGGVPLGVWGAAGGGLSVFHDTTKGEEEGQRRRCCVGGVRSWSTWVICVLCCLSYMK